MSQDARHRVESMGGRAIGPMAWVGWRHWSTRACCIVLYNFHGGCANAFFNHGHALEALGGAHLEPHLEPKATRRPAHVLVDDSAHLSWHAQTATFDLQSSRARAPMACTRAFPYPRASLEIVSSASIQPIYFSPGGGEGTNHASRHPPPSGGPASIGPAGHLAS